MTIFTRPRARSRLSAVSSQHVFREVNTEDELRAALYLENPPQFSFGSTGRRIVIASPISVKSPIIVTGFGITIESYGQIPISPSVDSLESIFDFDGAINSTIRDLVISNEYGVAQPLVSIKLGANNSMTNCRIYTGDVGVSISGYSLLTGSSILTDAASTAVFLGLSAGCFGSVVSQNIVAGLFGVVSGSFSGECVISSNAMNGSNINTSAGSGGNTIVGNTNVGTITNAVTDAVTSNT